MNIERVNTVLLVIEFGVDFQAQDPFSDYQLLISQGRYKLAGIHSAFVHQSLFQPSFNRSLENTFSSVVSLQYMNSIRYPMLPW